IEPWLKPSSKLARRHIPRLGICWNPKEVICLQSWKYFTIWYAKLLTLSFGNKLTVGEWQLFWKITTHWLVMRKKYFPSLYIRQIRIHLPRENRGFVSNLQISLENGFEVLFHRHLKFQSSR